MLKRPYQKNVLKSRKIAFLSTLHAQGGFVSFGGDKVFENLEKIKVFFLIFSFCELSYMTKIS